MAAIQEIVEKFNKHALGVVSAADLLLDTLRSAGLVYEMDIHCRQVSAGYAVVGHAFH